MWRLGPRIARTFDRTRASATRPRSRRAAEGPGGSSRSVGHGSRVRAGSGHRRLGQGSVRVGAGHGQGARLLGSPGEQAALDAATGLRGGCVVDLLHDARDDEKHRRLERGDVVDEVARVGGKRDHPLAGEQAVHDEARQDVCDREEQQGTRLRVVDEEGKEIVGLEHRGNEVAVREDDTLGFARRPRGVDDGGIVAEVNRVGACAHVFDGHRLGGAAQLSLGSAIEGQDVAHAIRAHGFDELGLLRGRRDNDADVGVGEDVGDLRRGVGLVDRNGDRPAGQGGDVNERPLVGGRCEDGEVFARLEANADQAAGDGVDFGEKLLHRDRPPCPHVRAPLDGQSPRVRGHALVKHLRQVHVIGGLARGDRLPRAVGEPTYRHCSPFQGGRVQRVSSSYGSQRGGSWGRAERTRGLRRGRRPRGCNRREPCGGAASLTG